MMAKEDFDVFLAHNSEDKLQVKAIGDALKRRGLKPWIDTEQIPPGRWVLDVIQQVIPQVKSVAIIIGPKGLGKWQSVELRAFISQCVEREIPVIPVLLPGVAKLSPELLFLKELNWVDFKESIHETEALDKLVWGITGKRPEPKPKQPEPESEQKGGEPKKYRRIDAAVPSHAEVGQHIDLLVQVRFPDSPLLGIEEWPTKHKPSSIEQVSEQVALKFPVDRRTGKLSSARLEVRINAPDFEIHGEGRQCVEVPPSEYSTRILFRLTPTKIGNCQINVEVYSVDDIYLGTVPVETTIMSGTNYTQAIRVSTLVFIIKVEGKTPFHKFIIHYIKRHPFHALVVMMFLSLNVAWGVRAHMTAKPGEKVSIWFGLIEYKKGPIPPPTPKPSPTPAPTSYPTVLPRSIKYIGRIIDNNTQKPIQGAKVSLDIRDAPLIVHTDFEGVYRFTVSPGSNSTLSGRVRIEASGYQPYDRFIDLSANNTRIEEIRLKRSSATPTPTWTPTLRPTPSLTPTLSPTSTLTPTPTPTLIPTLIPIPDDCKFRIKGVIVKDARDTSIDPVNNIYRIRMGETVTIRVNYTNPCNHEIGIALSSQRWKVQRKTMDSYMAKEGGKDVIEIQVWDQETGYEEREHIMIQVIP